MTDNDRDCMCGSYLAIALVFWILGLILLGSWLIYT